MMKRKRSAEATARNRILYVGRDESEFALLRLYLKQARGSAYRLDKAADPGEAANRIESEQFALCLIADDADGQFGTVFLRRFASAHNAPPMILIANRSGARARRQARDSGAVDSLGKPDLSPQLLTRAIDLAVARHDYDRTLWLSREHYRKIVDASLDAITVIDARGIIIGWNPQAERLFGFRRNEVIGNKLEDSIILPRRVAIFREWLAQAEQATSDPSADAFAVERTLRRKDGAEIPVLMNVARIADENGLAFVAFYQDLTVTRKEQERARRFESIVQSTADVVALLDRDFVYVAANEAHQRAWGRSPREILGRHLREVLGDELFEQRRRIIERALAGAALVDNVWVQLPRLGRRYWNIHYDPYRDAEGKLAGVVVNARDTTDQKLAEEALTRSHQLINAVLHLQDQYIREVEPTEVFRQLLGEVMLLTDSDFGFIGEIVTEDDGATSLKTYAFSDRATARSGTLADVAPLPRDTLAGAVVAGRVPVIRNEDAADLRPTGLPPGHPPFRAALCLPLIYGQDVLGLLVLANRPGGYHEEIIRQLEAITSASAGIINHWRSERRLARAEIRYRHLYDENPAMFFTLDRNGTVISANQYAANQLGYAVGGLVGMPFARVLHDADKELAMKALSEVFATPDSVRTWELRLLRRSGAPVWVRETARVTLATGGEALALVVCEDISGAKALSEQLSYQATHDALTDLVNRREFERRLGEAISSARFQAAEHAVCFIDLDQFKVVNDTCGHVAGDALLRDLSVMLLQRLRRRDTLARLGGDEFALLVEHCSLAQARQIAANVQRVVTEYQFSWEGHLYRLGCSIGVVPVNRASGDLHEVLRLADAACYAAKDAGRNTIHVHDEGDELIERRHGEMLWVERINRSLEQDLFRLAFQPIARTRGPRRGEHYEILMRLPGDDGRMILPNAFLPAAERYGVIGRLDRWAISTWFRWLKEHPEALKRLALSSINLSGHSLSDKTLLAFILEEADLWRIPPEKICFEVTETAAIANLAAAGELMSALQQRGFTFALDDFGSGLSSFAYLRALPVSYIKIDGVFVKDIAGNSVDRAMVRSINDVAHTMGKTTIAEFVEDDDALSTLAEIGVDYVQGYAIGQPQLIDTLPS